MDQHLKHCPICDNDLPVGSFGICRARPSGRNLYCKPCIRAKVTIARRNLKEYKSTRQRVLKEKYWRELKAAPAPVQQSGKQKQSPVDRVRDLIREQPRTQRELRTATKLHKDVIGEALATLLLWTHEVKSRIEAGERTYYLVEETSAPAVVNRKASVLAPFHELRELMPGKRAVG